ERRHPRLVEEDPAEVVAIGEDLGLEREEGATRVDEVQARQPVLQRHLLRAQVLLDGQREVGATLHRCVVRDDDALAALDDADARSSGRRWRLTLIETPRRQSVQLQERRARIQEAVDPLSRRQLAPRPMTLERALTTALRDGCGAAPQLADQLFDPRATRLEPIVSRRSRLQD